MNNIIEINYITIGILSVLVVSLFTILFILLKQKYESKLKASQEKFLVQNEHNKQNLENITQNYNLKLHNQKELFNSKEEKLLDEFKLKEESLLEKINLVENSKQQLKLEFESLANKLFDENHKKSNTNLNQVLTNFKGQLDSFGKRVNDIYNDETKQRTSLLTEIKNLKELNNKISSDAINLTKALKGENKTQGDWGEMILSSILEQTGLREGKEYSTQGSYTDEDGKRLRPDVIVHLPSNKDIIIDSKVSLNAYLDYANSENDLKKEQALKDLVSSLKAHIKGLSIKKYEDIEQLRSLDFVLMFIPIEQAFLLATSKDETLFKTAFESNIMLVSPSTLFVTLRTIENIWRNEHQNENALLISKKAADLYDKFAGFVKDMDDIGTNINRTQKSYDNALNKLSMGRGNLLRRSQEFIDLGVKPKKEIDVKKLIEE
jgi:DNA recombination protein RmuC